MKQSSIDQFKIQAAILHSFFYHCFHKLQDKLPDCVLKIEADLKLREVTQHESKSNLATLYAAYCLQSYDAPLIKKFNPNPAISHYS
jgi:hypothetical protein